MTTVKAISSTILPALLIASGVGAAEPGRPLAELPVDAMKPMAVAEYGKAAALAARKGAPLEIALAIVGPFEGATQQIIQVNQGVEAPSASRVTVLRDGLLDDSVRSERWEIALERTGGGAWKISEVRRAWRCRRGPQTDRFAAERCM